MIFQELVSICKRPDISVITDNRVTSNQTYTINSKERDHDRVELPTNTTTHKSP